MSPVGGSRHYTGSGLGQIGLWGCPSCGEDNTGPLTAGCVHCGAGRPATPPPAPPTPPPASPPESSLLNEYQAWVERHPDATVEEAFTAGYIEGVRAARKAQLAAQPPAAVVDTSDAKTYRTVIAALAMFRDQILSAEPEEVESGEWLTPAEANSVIAQLQGLLGSPREVSV